MKISRKTSVEGNWAKMGSDIKDGDRLKILDAGQIVEGDFGPRKVFQVMTTKKQEYNLSFNQTSLNNLVEAFGEESEEWVGKVVKAFVVRQMVGDGLKNVGYLAAEGWMMDDDGKFYNPEVAKERTGYPKDDISPDDIPF